MQRSRESCDNSTLLVILGMPKTLILLLLSLGVAQAQQTPKPQQSSEELYTAAYKGDRIAMQQLITRAEQGDAVAQYSLGVMYELGRSMLKDAPQAAVWYRKAADQGFAKAQYYLGIMYANGDGVPKDAAQAAAWFRKAADQGDVGAQNYLGGMYANGVGVPKDAAQAEAWFRKAADQGDQNARSRLVGETTPVPIPRQDNRRFAPMLEAGGVYWVPVLINGAIALNFIVDSGAADVSIPTDVVTTLMRTGTITQSDFGIARTYTLADGSTKSERTIRIKSLKVGDIVVQDVIGSVADRDGDLLLGQSFLGRFKSWSVDNTKHVLILE